MDINDGLIGGLPLLIALGLWGAMLMLSMRRAALRPLAASERLHVYLGATVVMLTLWMIRAGVDAGAGGHRADGGLNLHLLAVTAMTLMFGWRLATLAVSAVLVLTALNGAAGWSSLGVNFLTMGAAPILLTQAVLSLARRLLPLHFFVYVFVNAFLCGGLSVVLSGALSAVLLYGFGPYDAAYLADHYFYALMFFPEAVFNGMVMTLVIAYRPGWAVSFADELYLEGK